MSESWEGRLSAASDMAPNDPDWAESELRSVKAEIDARIKEVRERIAQPRKQAKDETDERIRQYFINHDPLPRIKDAAVALGLPVHRITKIRQAVYRQRVRDKNEERNRQRQIEIRCEILDGTYVPWNPHGSRVEDAVRKGDFLTWSIDDPFIRHSDEPAHLIALEDGEEGQTIQIDNIG